MPSHKNNKPINQNQLHALKRNLQQAALEIASMFELKFLEMLEIFWITDENAKILNQ